MGTNGLDSLTKLRGLRSLCLDADQMSEWPTFVSLLTSLTRLQVRYKSWVLVEQDSQDQRLGNVD